MSRSPVEGRPLLVAPAWIEAHCAVPDGFKKGQPLRLYDFQLRYALNFYSVRTDAEWIPEAPLLSSAFVNRVAMLVGPQKLGKNPWNAAHALVEARGPSLFAGWAGKDDGYACSDWGCSCGWEYPYDRGEPMGMMRPTSLIQITAVSEDSTKNTWGWLKPMVEEGPLGDSLSVGQTECYLPNGGLIEIVTSSAPARLGNPVTFAEQDEVGLWTPQNKLLKLSRAQRRGAAGMGGRVSMTTNAWDPSEECVAKEVYESTAPDVYVQFDQPPRNLSYTDRRDRERIHRIVYPPDTWRRNGGHVELAAIDAEAAELVEKDPNEAARFFGNKLVAGSGSAVDPDLWDELANPTRDVLPGEWIGLGFDGSMSKDSTFLRGCTRDGFSFIIAKFERPKGEEMTRWADEHPGQEWRVDRQQVDAAVRLAFTVWGVGRMYADPWMWQSELQDWANEFGEDRVLEFDTRQGGRIGPAVKMWTTAIEEWTHTHDGDPSTTAHVKAAHLRKLKLRDPDDDGRTLYTLEKPADGRKIDAAMSDVLAFVAAMTMPQPPAKKKRAVYSF